MKYPNSPIFFLALILAVSACTNNKPPASGSEVEIAELQNYASIPSPADEVLVLPVVLKYDHSGILFVYDQALGKVFQLNTEGEVLREYGQSGRGPGEFQRVVNVYVKEEKVYVIDPGKYTVHVFHQDTGELESSFAYGEVASQQGAPPPAPMSIGDVQARDIHNMPWVSPKSEIVLPALYDEGSNRALYKRSDMDGNIKGYLGSAPEGSTFHLDNQKIREDVLNGEIPSYYKPNTFPVIDQANPKEVFLVYSAYPKIKKYTIEGEELWETEVLHTPQIDSAIAGFFEWMEMAQSRDIRNRIPLEHYVAGVSDENGNLYLAMERDPLWIDQFNPTGELVKRYKLDAEEEGVAVTPVFDLDTENNRFLMVTTTGEIRAYSLD